MQRRTIRSWFLMFFLASIVVQFLASQTPRFPATSLRKALVIGNASYGTLGRLANPGNDATDMAAVLKKLGFEVELLLDASSATMDEALVRFGQALATDQAAVGFFYFAGHGIQSGSVNYLIPVGVDIGSESLLKHKALALPAVLDTMGEAKNTLNIIVLDACRNNPFGWSRSGTRGLSVVGTQPAGSIIAYATGAGGVSIDGSGRNGIFTAALLERLALPDTDIAEVFRLTGKEVAARTGGAQVPAVYSQFFDTWRLVETSAPLPGPGSGPGVGGLVPSAPVIFERASGTGFRSSSGTEAGQGKSPLPVSPLASTPVQRSLLAMVSVDGGLFDMGSVSGDPDESPRHLVGVSSFIMSAHPVSVDEFSEVVRTSGLVTTAERLGYGHIVRDSGSERVKGLNWKKPGHAQSGQSPVTMVSWLDALAFCNALSIREGLAPVYRIEKDAVVIDMSGSGYRLPTEAEWEFAASGGLRSRGNVYAGSSSPAEVAWYKGNSSSAPMVRGVKYPNELGLYEMSGSVWEWCQDWYGPYDSARRMDPVGVAEGSFRVIRGGSWKSGADSCTITNRGGGDPLSRNDIIGFRVVRRP